MRTYQVFLSSLVSLVLPGQNTTTSMWELNTGTVKILQVHEKVMETGDTKYELVWGSDSFKPERYATQSIS